MHGGDIYNNKIEYDFSVNINPYGPYPEVVSAVKNALSDLRVYPEYNSDRLRQNLADYHSVPQEYICITNGASEALISIIGNQYVSDVVIEIPSFFGYERAVNPEQQLHTYTRNSFIKLNENLIPKNSVLVMGNPSNPTGEFTDIFKIESLYKRVKSAGSILLIDESFLPLSDYSNMSLIEKIKEDENYYNNLVIVRSFTKSFSIPALRLGYFITSNVRLVNIVQNSLPEWNISVPAQVAGLECINHFDRLADDYKKIKSQRIRLEKELKQFGFLVHESHTNYLMFTAPKFLYDKLIEKGILIRDCTTYRGIDEIVEKLVCMDISLNEKYSASVGTSVFRIAVKTQEENTILINAISSILENN